jgi:hypothetical protein
MRIGQADRDCQMLNKGAEAPVHGTVAPGFEEVEGVFRENFLEQNELGAAQASRRRAAPTRCVARPAAPRLVDAKREVEVDHRRKGDNAMNKVSRDHATPVRSSQKTSLGHQVKAIVSATS